MEDPDAAWQRVRETDIAWNAILRRVRAGEVTPAEAAAELRELLSTMPEEAMAMGGRRARLADDLRAKREGR